MDTIKNRPLYDTTSVSLFLKNIIGVDPTSSKTVANACKRIRDAENLLSQYFPFSTVKSEKYRDPRYVEDVKREILREKIIKELLSKQRLKNDNKIRLGSGGLLPAKKLEFKNKFFLITGLPASGKSGVAEKLADKTSSILIDNDYAKRKFPEFTDDYGPAIVHEEAELICEGPIADPKYKGLNIIDQAILAKANIVLPKICPTSEKIKGILAFFVRKKYKCFLVHVQLSREQATIRAYTRYLSTGRYVPLALIYDGYANDPTIAYFETRNLPDWAGYARLSTDVMLGKKPKILERKNLATNLLKG
jgi:hypothetical protein